MLVGSAAALRMIPGKDSSSPEGICPDTYSSVRCLFYSSRSIHPGRHSMASFPRKLRALGEEALPLSHHSTLLEPCLAVTCKNGFLGDSAPQIS